VDIKNLEVKELRK